MSWCQRMPMYGRTKYVYRTYIIERNNVRFVSTVACWSFPHIATLRSRGSFPLLRVHWDVFPHSVYPSVFPILLIYNSEGKIWFHPLVHWHALPYTGHSSMFFPMKWPTWRLCSSPTGLRFKNSAENTSTPTNLSDKSNHINILGN